MLPSRCPDTHLYSEASERRDPTGPALRMCSGDGFESFSHQLACDNEPELRRGSSPRVLPLRAGSQQQVRQRRLISQWGSVALEC